MIKTEKIIFDTEELKKNRLKKITLKKIKDFGFFDDTGESKGIGAEKYLEGLNTDVQELSQDLYKKYDELSKKYDNNNKLLWTVAVGGAVSLIALIFAVIGLLISTYSGIPSIIKDVDDVNDRYESNYQDLIQELQIYKSKLDQKISSHQDNNDLLLESIDEKINLSVKSGILDYLIETKE